VKKISWKEISILNYSRLECISFSYLQKEAEWMTARFFRHFAVSRTKCLNNDGNVEFCLLEPIYAKFFYNDIDRENLPLKLLNGDEAFMVRELLGRCFFFFTAYFVSGPLRSRSLQNSRRVDRSDDRLCVNTSQTQAVTCVAYREKISPTLIKCKLIFVVL
jgi:hypothetical protein